LALTTPSQSQSLFVKRSNNGVKTKAKDCTESEVFDNDLEICAPITNTPVPISAEMMNKDVSPCSSFFKYTSGKWIERHNNTNRAFTYLYDKNRKQVFDIIRDPASGPVYNFYRSCLDTLVLKQHRRETLRQITHVKEYIQGALTTHADLPIVFARLAKYGFNSPFSMTIERHPKKKEMVPLFRYDTVPGFQTELTNQLNMWHTIVEENMQKSFLEYVEIGDFDKDMISMKEFVDIAPRNFWQSYLRELNGVSSLERDLLLDPKSQQIWVLDAGYFRHMLVNLDRFSVAEWKRFVEASINHNTEDFLPLLPNDSYFRRHERQPIGPNIWMDHKFKKEEDSVYTETQCLIATHKLLPGLVAQEFLRRDMPHSEETRSRVTRMVESLRDAYADLVRATPWMSEKLKDAATEKIHSMIVRAVHPNTWEVEPFAMRLTRDRYLRNLNLIRRYRAQRNYQLWTISRHGLDRDVIQRFGAPLTTVNAYYSPTTNTITVFAGLVREPFYSAKFSDAALYATLGMVCGHELSHGLDPMGRQFDKDGLIKSWWTSEDVRNFNTQSECIIGEYGAPPGCLNAQYGKQTLGEDMADIIGTMVAWRAFNKMKPDASEKEKRDFFVIFGQLWAASSDAKHLCKQVESEDVHAIPWFRVDKTLRQMPEYAELFHCKRGDEMVNKRPCKIYG